MPPKLTVSDYVFYITPDKEGKYRFKDTRGNINRMPKEEYYSLCEFLRGHEREEFNNLLGIASVEIVETGEHTLVYDIFEDLRDEVVPMPRQAILIPHLLETIEELKQENQQLKVAIDQLKKLLQDNNILIITPEEK